MSENTTDTIFVQIASYRDPQLIPTLQDLLDKASRPELLHICVCWQHGDDEAQSDFEGMGVTFHSGEGSAKLPYSIMQGDHTSGAKFTVLDTHYHNAKGACWARYQIQTRYDNEKYTLQLDSHHRFVEGWDDLCIEMVEQLRSEECPKPLLTAYIPSFNPVNDPAERVQAPWKMDFDRFIPEGAVFFRPSTIDDWQERDQPMASRFYSAHFCFADGTFVTEVPHDPDYFFHGEEISIAVRAYTWGYDLFHPHKVVAWHEYTRVGRTKVWDDHGTDQKVAGNIDLDWVERNDLCHRRNRVLFGMDGEDPAQIDFGQFGFGDVRTVRQYEEHAGISFQYRGVQQKTIDRLDPPNAEPYTTEEEWKNTFAISNDVHICFHHSELGNLVEDYDFFYVGCHDENGDEIERKDLERDQIYNYINSPNGFFDYRLIFLSTRKPVQWTVWAHSESQGWLTKIDKPVNY